jgi:hypothetical protein
VLPANCYWSSSLVESQYGLTIAQRCSGHPTVSLSDPLFSEDIFVETIAARAVTDSGVQFCARWSRDDAVAAAIRGTHRVREQPFLQEIDAVTLLAEVRCTIRPGQ